MNTIKAIAIAITLLAGASATANSAFAGTDGYHWAYADAHKR